MRAFHFIFFCFAITFLFVSCSGSSDVNDPITNPTTNNNSNQNTNQWLIPLSEVRDGGPGKDGIPSIDNPQFASVGDAEAQFSDDFLVIGINVNGEARAYPHYILDWHEIINDDVNDVSVAVTYCPLTGTTFGWNRIVEGIKTTFGVSGLLYNSNLIPYDRESDSNWSQMKQLCVNGELIGEKPSGIQLIETTWGDWKKMYPNTTVLTTQTGFERDYSMYPYGDYKTNHDFLLFPVCNLDTRLPGKERVHSLKVGNLSKVYRFNSFAQGNVIKDVVNGDDILLVGNTTTIVSFKLNSSQNSLSFEYSFDNGETLFTDNEGTHWNVFGEAIAGPRIGEKLEPTASFMSYWFAVGAFYPNTTIFSEG